MVIILDSLFPCEISVCPGLEPFYYTTNPPPDPPLKTHGRHENTSNLHVFSGTRLPNSMSYSVTFALDKLGYASWQCLAEALDVQGAAVNSMSQAVTLALDKQGYATWQCPAKALDVQGVVDLLADHLESGSVLLPRLFPCLGRDAAGQSQTNPGYCGLM